LLTSNAQTDERLDRRTSVYLLGLRSVLCVPLKVKDKVSGAIYVDNRIKAGLFSEADLELLSAVASNAAVAIENARLFREAQNKLETLRLLHEIGADLTATLDLERVLTGCLQRVQNLLNTEAASILTVEENELVFQVAIGDKSDEIKPFRVPLGSGFASWVVLNKQGLIVNDVQNDPRFFKEIDAGTGFVSRGLMAAPLVVNDRAIGVIEVFNKRQGPFVSADLELLATIASSAAIAIENARLYEVAVEKGRMERELQMARKMQNSLLPDRIPQLAGWDFAARWIPAREVAGDYYDFLTHDPNKLGLVIGDVTDKGMPAALFMVFTRSIIRASLDRVEAPAEGLTHANHLICDESTNGFFVTLFFAQIDTQTNEITYVSAGHDPQFLYRAATHSLEMLEPTGMPLGIDESVTYRQATIKLESSDFIFFYTDGVTDALNKQQHSFGRERLSALLLENHQASAAEMITALENAIKQFTGETAPFDDITIMVAKRL
jgi:sigma-B regulation protein RsbU (phosphoserine phosphatase)